MLSERQNKILKLIVERYIKDPIPVGSKVISKELNCSSATVRNEMGELENQGLLEKTHTSSGRVPSEAGYRYYVDNLMELKQMNAEDMLKLQIVFKNQQLAISDVITKSLQVISDMTNYTAVVLGSTSHENLLKQIEVVPIDEASMIVIIVTDKGHVEHKNIRLEDVSMDEVKKTVGLINNLISGTPIDEVSRKLEFEIKPIIGNYVKQHEQLYNAFYHVFSDFTNQEVNVMGRSKMLEQPEFSSNIDKVKNVFNKLESPELVQNITEDDDKNIKIYIGKENNIDNDVTVIQTKYKQNGQEGTIAIIGPKRMEYDRVVGMLEYIKENIER
ncbi:MAG: heat-inducible transcription repressor HrcA [Bacilli bacterium]|nr:heat-inducible transcription repressor HrcA [Bacilli bacterium]MBR6137546.1 heat-inducible transcription repressor HrcA [Bacilli bacterium]